MSNRNHFNTDVLIFTSQINFDLSSYDIFGRDMAFVIFSNNNIIIITIYFWGKNTF